jgi:hypothetical protein
MGAASAIHGVAVKVTIAIPIDLAGAVASAIYDHADMYRHDKGHDPEGIASLCADADRMDAIADEIGAEAGRINARAAKEVDRG